MKGDLMGRKKRAPNLTDPAGVVWVSGAYGPPRMLCSECGVELQSFGFKLGRHCLFEPGMVEHLCRGAALEVVIEIRPSRRLT